MSRRPLITLALVGTATIASASLATVTGASAASAVNNSFSTTSPIKHVVVLFQENVSFDHYFGTYPNATNADGHPFKAKPGTPTSQRAHTGAADRKSQRGEPAAARRGKGPHLRPEP